MPTPTLPPPSAFEQSLWLAAHPWPPSKRKMYDPLDVIRLLNAAKVRFVLVGAHGLAEWVDDPRHTQDVDLVVMDRHLTKATKSLQAAFPKLAVEDHEVVVRFREPKTHRVVIDLIKQRALFREAFNHVEERKQGRQRFLIPSVEMALAMKFAAMLSPNREDKDRFQDAHDFINVIHHNQELDDESLASLGELVFGGGGKRLLGLVADVRAGRKLTI